MRLTIVGSGDAFGTGGRLNTCFHIAAREATFLIDCGASSLIGLHRLGLKASDIDAVFITHLHGDHFGGLPWILIEAQHVSKRNRPLVIVGPESIEQRFIEACEAMYPNSTAAQRDFEFVFLTYRDRAPLAVCGVSVTPFEVRHPAGAPPYALRFEIEEKVLGFSGDTGWTDSLYDAAHAAHLFIIECYQYDRKLDLHLDFKTIDANYARLGAKRLLLTHMGEAMLARAPDVDPSRYAVAYDGLTIDL